MQIKLIADIGSNHNQNFERAKELIKDVAKFGIWGVKFQCFDPDRLYKKSLKQNNILKKRALPIAWIPELYKYAKEKNVKFGVTPFYKGCVKELENNFDFLKISSFDVLRADLINECFDTNKLTMISLGLAENIDIYKISTMYNNVMAKNRIQRKKSGGIVLMHCISKYPVKAVESCTNRIKYLNDIYSGWSGIGYSDHSSNTVVIMSAIMNGAEYIEFHYDRDHEGVEYKYKHCWDWSDTADLTNLVFNLSRISSKTFKLTRKELKLRANPKNGLREHL